jgi:hypothetical protein
MLCNYITIHSAKNIKSSSIFTLLDSPWSSLSFTLWSTYCLLISLLLLQSIPVHFRICINLAQFTWSNISCKSMKQAHSSSSMYKVHSDIILSILIYSELKPNINCNTLNQNEHVCWMWHMSARLNISSITFKYGE